MNPLIHLGNPSRYCVPPPYGCAQGSGCYIVDDDRADSDLINNRVLLEVSPDEYYIPIPAAFLSACLSVCLSKRLPGLMPASSFFLAVSRGNILFSYMLTAGEVGGTRHSKTPTV